MKYTPGPWNKTEDKLTQQYYIARPYGKSVLHIANVTKEDIGYGISEEEYHANASLIAAAPELLEACKEALEALHNLMPDERMKKANCWNPSEYEKCSCTSCKLKRVIAKAEGRV